MPKPYRRADEPGPGSGRFISLSGNRYQIVKGEADDPEHQVTFNEAVMVAQWISALTLLGQSRENAEASALEKLKEFRQAKKFFGG